SAIHDLFREKFLEWVFCLFSNSAIIFLWLVNGEQFATAVTRRMKTLRLHRCAASSQKNFHLQAVLASYLKIFCSCDYSSHEKHVLLRLLVA
ncbi:hypothetical protein JQK62_22685, partial [Leptospira santarosai]|nr:hypothetical protein [Leptospira santarosai]